MLLGEIVQFHPLWYHIGVENQTIQEINKALYDWNFWGAGLPTGIPREKYTDLVYKKYTESDQVLVITGPRRAGKSFVMRQFCKRLINNGLDPKSTLYINFEDPRLAKVTAPQLLEIVDNYKRELPNPEGFIVLLDEIQEIKGWEKSVRTMYETSTARLMLSGSNSKLLSGELASSLTGRHVDITVYPLSFKEYKTFRDYRTVTTQGNSVLLNNFLETGGFPQAVLSQNPKEILLTYWNDLLEKDLIKRYGIRKEGKFKELAMFYLTNTSNLITFGKLEKSMDIKSTTIDNYSAYMENAFLMFFPTIFSYKYKEINRNPKKVYCVDTGLQNFAGFNFSQNLGWKMENLIFLELLKCQKYQTRDVHYWKNEQHKEVDFVVKHTDGLQAVQACWDASNPQTIEREKSSLMLGLKDLKLEEGWIISSETSCEMEESGKKIHVVPVLDWIDGL